MYPKRVFHCHCLFGLLAALFLSLNDCHAKPSTSSPYRGWDYLANKLLQDGIPKHVVIGIYGSKQMPVFTSVPFSLKPGESARMYQQFLSDKRLRLAQQFIARHETAFRKAESDFGVDRYTIAAIMLIESQFGQYTGRSLAINRLSRLANIADPNNVKKNTLRLQRKDPTVTLEQVQQRAAYLEDTFYQEIPALIEVAKRNDLSAFSIRGSSAGAFGLPQFLPSAYIRFGIDADRDGRVSLFTPADAISSTANFLGSYGWLPEIPRDKKVQVLWKYNRSEPYIEAVMNVAARLKAMNPTASPVPKRIPWPPGAPNTP